ncbi:uncharacterized protein LOC126679292 [Mercurialis annua]|uniref:uncharacterized protein LOC126679292 n=1 Tax=Mercurialis annua TaxID=3986 RepID=UPI0021606011|nr:uncharacterized protein LOC126679292 [Mercurialis annua]
MKLVWSPETALKAYIETVESCQLFQESSVAELISATAAGWNAKLIVETWSQGGVIATSIGLAIASRQTDGRHVCVVPDERSRTEYAEAMGEAGMSSEVMVGEADDVMEWLDGVDFMVLDSRQKDFSRVLRLTKFSSRGAVVVCKNANSRSSNFRWRGALEEGSRRIVRSVFLPVGKGLDIAHVAASGGNSEEKKGEKKWIKHIDTQSGEEHVIRK